MKALSRYRSLWAPAPFLALSYLLIYLSMPQYFPYNPSYADIFPELNVVSDLISYSTYGPWGAPPPHLEMDFWYHPPLYYILISPFAVAGTSNLWGLFAVALVFQYLTLSLVYLICEELKEGSGVWGIATLSVVPTWWESFVLLRPDTVMVFFMVLTLHLYLRKRRRGALLSSMLGINVKYPFGCVFLSVLPSSYLDFLKLLLSSIFALLPYGIWALVRTGSFLAVESWIRGPPFALDPAVRSFPYWLPDKYTLILLAITFIGICWRKIPLNEKNRGILLVALSNLLLYYLTVIRLYYYLVPTSVFLCILTAQPTSSLTSASTTVLRALRQRVPPRRSDLGG